MRFLQRDSVRAFLPLVALAFCHGCGGAASETAGTQGSSSGALAETNVPANRAPTITVADATHQTVIHPFEITVVDAAIGVAKLEWEKPLTKFDGSPLDDLAGYRIAYGHDASDLDASVYLDDPEQRTYEFATLGSGVWYFEVIAVSADGLEGPPSPSATKSI